MNLPAQDEDFQSGMRKYIRHHFGDILGEHAALLDDQEGVDKLLDMVRDGRLARR